MPTPFNARTAPADAIDDAGLGGQLILINGPLISDFPCIRALLARIAGRPNALRDFAAKLTT